MKIKLKKLQTIEILEPIVIDDFKEYLLALIVSPAGKFHPPKSSDKPEEPIQFMEVLMPKLLQEVGGKRIKIRQGKTQSQFQRALLEEIAALKGLDIEKHYQDRMTQNIEKLIKERDELDE